MEWVETTGVTIEEAKEAALDQLGVAADEAEFEVVEEEKTGLFGRVRRQARVRARVRPAQPRAKVERRPSRGRRGARDGRARGSGGARPPKETSRDTSGNDKPRTEKRRSDKPRSDKPRNERSREKPRETPDQATGDTPPTDRADAPAPDRRSEQSRPSPKPRRRPARSAPTNDQEPTVSDPVTLDQQADIVEDFLDGLLDAIDLDGDLDHEVTDDGEAVEVRVEGDDLGLLIGPRGNTLQAVQELARAVVQRQADGPVEGRLRLDIAGYRNRRRAALASFARQQADEVKADGRERALEPMIPADRKIVHDTINEIDGVSTISEGEDANRRVVIIPGD